MTTLSAIQIAQLSAIVAGETGYKRSATKDAAIARFRKLCDEVSRPVDADMILAIASYDEAAEALRGELKAAKETDAAEAKASPGLARLKANADTEALRAATVADADAARAAVLKTRPQVEPKDRTTGADALGPMPQISRVSRKAAVALAEAAAPAKVEKVKEAPKPKAAKPEGSATRTKLATDAVITSVKDNPKKQGSRAHQRFALYAVGKTVQAFIDACIAAGFPAEEAKADLSWDRRKGFITIG